jgi:hypothetical protein
LDFIQPFFIFIVMVKNIKKGLFPFLIGLSALSVSASAAYYSVSGLSKLFAGASLEVMIMASSLEFAKLVTASLLYQYWEELSKSLKVYLSIATIVLVLITSMGIYGFLSSAYQDTYRQLTVKENQTKFLEQKKNFYEADVIRYDAELERISSNIASLSNAKSTAIQIKDASVVGGIRTSISTTELRLAQQRIGVEEENRKQVQSKREIVADSLQKYQLKILELENNDNVAGELGPLQYLSGLTGAPMDKIINILLLVIIFVFDPLAIALVIASNFAFDKAYPKKQENLYGELQDDFSEWDDLDDEDEETDESYFEEDDDEDDEYPEPNEALKNAFKNYEDLPIKVAGEEFDILDLNQDGIVDENEIDQAHQKLFQLQNQLNQNPSGWRRNKIKNEIKELQSRLNSEEDTKTY